MNVRPLFLTPLLWLFLIGTVLAAPPNILVIVADDLGYGDLGYTGHRHIKSPNIDRLAEEGGVLANFYAPASVCSPTRAAMMTGRQSYRHGIYGFIHVGDPYVHLPKDEVTIPQLFRTAGYQTALSGKWHVSLNDYRKKFPRIPSMDHYGFDYWFSSDNNTVIHKKPDWWRNGKSLGVQTGYAAEVVGDDAVRWLKEERDEEKPFLQFVHFYEPHWYVDAPRELVDGYLGSATTNENEAYYFAAVENVDRQVGRVLDAIDEEGLRENTLVFFTSDHGPATEGKGRGRFRNFGVPDPYRGRKYGLWEGSVHVPGIVRWPAEVKAGTNWTAPCGAIDWLPTFCDLADVKVPDGLQLDGESFAPLVGGKDWNRKQPLQWHHYNATLLDSPNPNAVMRDGDLLICGFYDARPKGTGRWVAGHMDFIRNAQLKRFTLYDLSKDLTQERDLADVLPEKFEAMKKRLIESHLSIQGAARDWEGWLKSR